MFFLWLRQLPLMWWSDPCSVPPPTEGRSSHTNTPTFPPSSSYQLLCGSIYSFPLVSYSCPLSAGVLHALLCLKVYSWCIRGERCTPCPPTPLPSCSPCRWILYQLSHKGSPMYCTILYYYYMFLDLPIFWWGFFASLFRGILSVIFLFINYEFNFFNVIGLCRLSILF